jgi:hypothetical protein
MRQDSGAGAAARSVPQLTQNFVPSTLFVLQVPQIAIFFSSGVLSCWD